MPCSDVGMNANHEVCDSSINDDDNNLKKDYINDIMDKIDQNLSDYSN